MARALRIVAHSFDAPLGLRGSITALLCTAANRKRQDEVVEGRASGKGQVARRR